MHKIILPLDEEKIEILKAGDEVSLNGIIYSARDQAHKKMFDQIQKNEKLPIDLRNNVIYYMAPTPAPPGFVIGSCGPTTASRMDKFTPILLKNGIKGMVGKGMRNQEVVDAIVKNRAVYFYAYGGCGALYAGKIKKNNLAAYPELGPEAIFELTVKDFQVIVAIDYTGKCVFAHI